MEIHKALEDLKKRREAVRRELIRRANESRASGATIRGVLRVQEYLDQHSLDTCSITSGQYYFMKSVLSSTKNPVNLRTYWPRVYSTFKHREYPVNLCCFPIAFMRRV